MPSPEQVSEGRRTLADKITDAQGYAHRGGFTRTTVFLTDIDVEVLLAALRADPARGEEEMEDRIDTLEEALYRIREWADAYPLTIFPEPDLKKARVLLEAGGMTLDSISAYCMRHVVKGVGGIARRALAQEKGGGDAS